MNFFKMSVFLLLWISSIHSIRAQSQYDYNELMSVEDQKKDLQLLRSNLEEVHPGLYRYHSKEEFRILFDAIKNELNTPITAVDFYRRLLPLLPLIANNHTKIQCPITYENVIGKTALRFPFRLYHRNNKSYVYADLSDEQVIGAGREILKINGRTMEEILTEMIGYTSVDGFNTSIAYYGLGVAFSRRYAYYFGTPAVFEIEYVDANNKIRTTSIKGQKAPLLNQRRAKHAKPKPEEIISFSITNEIAYLRITSFQPKSASNFKKQIRNAFKEIKENEVPNLIIDVRDNGGGYGEAANEVLSYLISTVVHPYKDEYALVKEIPYERYYEKDFFFKHFKRQPLEKKGRTYHIKNITSQKIQPKKTNFHKKLFILQNAASASATGEFLGLAKSYTKAEFIGEEAGGNGAEFTANDLLHMTLPRSGVRLTIPALRTELNVTFQNTGYGVQPDYEIIPTIDDILNEKDVVLEYVYQKINQEN